MAKMGRPPIQISKEHFEALCQMFCTEEEIAGFFGCSVDTINRWCIKTYDKTFAETYKIKSANGKISLRRHQMKLAEKYPAMAIWLGKQVLNQKDNIEVDSEETLRRLDEVLAQIKGVD